ncbi:MAG: hypothetical protein IJT38_05740 [Clostridia bacterium]|nr:hypothetical protein [Clostridia bacterium]
MRVSEAMSQAIEDFLEKVPELDAHESARDNPHGVTKEQVGLGNVANAEQATKTEFNAHANDAGNPHGVTKAQVGLGSVLNAEQATKAEFDAHKNNTGNPHGVTKAQVGLGNVTNDEQATKAEYNAHKSGTADRHTADDIDYSESHTVKQKIDELVIEGGGGTMYHDELLNTDYADAHPISAITGLEDRLDEVIIFEGETTGAETVRLTSNQDSDFVYSEGSQYDGSFTMPEGVAANVEIVGGCVCYAYDSQEGKYIINSPTGTCFFRTEGAIAHINAIVKPVLSTIAVYDMKSNLQDETPALTIQNGYVKTIVFNATGVTGKTLKWRVAVRLKNIINLNS